MPCREKSDVDLASLGLTSAVHNKEFTLLRRPDNAGGDLGGHNVTLRYLMLLRHLEHYK